MSDASEFARIHGVPRTFACGCEFVWDAGEMTAQPCSEAHALLLEAMMP